MFFKFSGFKETKMPPPAENLCGLSCCRPGWLQRFANTKTFIVVYGILGTIQAMSFMYFVVTITTIEKRFKISSKVTGTLSIIIIQFCANHRFAKKMHSNTLLEIRMSMNELKRIYNKFDKSDNNVKSILCEFKQLLSHLWEVHLSFWN